MGRLKQRTGGRITVTLRLRGSTKWSRLQCVIALRGRAQDGMTTRSAGRAISRYETKPRSEHAAMRAVIESAECSSLSVATSPLTTAPVAIWMQPVAAPAAPAICGKGSIAPCIAFGAIKPKAKVPRTRSEMTRASGIQSASVIISNNIAAIAASTSPIVSG